MRDHIRRPWPISIAAIGVSVASFWALQLVTADTPAPALVEVTVASLAKTNLTPIGDATYWKVASAGRPRASGASAYVSADRKFDAGVSQYERVTLELKDWPIDEFMYIVEGQVEITDASGHKRVYGPGEAFVMPKGFNGTWKQLSDIKKIQVSYGDPLE